jgi:TolB protein
LVADECNQGGADIALINAESLEITNLTEGQCPSTFRPPEWSPDGLYIVYETVEDGDPINPIQLSLLDLDQGVSIPLTGHFSSQDRNPEWSPDGNYITYVSDREGSLDIWKMNADGSDPINLTADLVE